MLEPVEQVGDASSQNLLIQGDNLDALKALLPFYAGRVKCIFIDPPYNTKSAFEHYDDNLEHSQWLSMMYPRLELLRDLLSEDGSIWVTIDDNEAHYLKVVMDEVFGRKNFIANMVWQKRTSRENRAAVGSAHDHLLVFAKKPATEWKEFRNLLPAKTTGFRNPDQDPRGDWRPVPFTAQGFRANQMYEIVTPSGKVVTPPTGRCWGGTRATFDAALASGRVYFGKNGDAQPTMKTYKGEETGLVPMTWWTADEVSDNTAAKRHILDLFPEHDSPFDTPKPEQLLNRIIHIATNSSDIVLDSYLGSGTTAAVAHKMGRRYIGIEMGEHAVTHCLPRLKKVVEGEQGGISEAVGWKGGGGFRFMKLGEPVFLDDGRINPAVGFATLASYLWFLEAGTPHATNKFDTPLLGTMGGEQNEDGTSSPRTAIILLYNGILGDKRPQAGNVLTTPIWNGILAQLPAHDGPRIIYGEACRLSTQRLKQLGVTFKQIPYDIRMR
jgi:adenine-specific DNA-methyltransferase